MTAKLNPLSDEYILWSVLPDVERGALSSEIEWARSKNITDRTIRRWKDNPLFVERRQQLASVTRVTRVADAAPAEVSSADEGDYHVVKQTLVEGAKGGNPKYLELYFKTYGKPFVEEETAARSATFAGEDMDSLVAEAVVLLGDEILAEALRKIGWTVVRE